MGIKRQPGRAMDLPIILGLLLIAFVLAAFCERIAIK
jgi:hypothetical protein